MPRKTLALISGLVLVTVILFVVALRAGQQPAAPSVPPQQAAQNAVPTTPAHTVLNVGPNPLVVAPGTQGSAQVNIDASDNDVTAIQLEIGYDPNVITNVKVIPGTLIQNPAVLIDKNSPTTGRYTYAFGITPNGTPIKGQGVAATITFTVKPGTVVKETQLGLLPTSLVTARGVAASVMKSATGTILTIGTPTGGAVGSTKPAVIQPTVGKAL